MIPRISQNRTLKALDIAALLHEAGISFKAAAKVPISQGPFWTKVVEKTGRKGTLSIETKREALYYLAALEIGSRKLKVVR